MDELIIYRFEVAFQKQLKGFKEGMIDCTAAIGIGEYDWVPEFVRLLPDEIALLNELRKKIETRILTVIAVSLE